MHENPSNRPERRSLRRLPSSVLGDLSPLSHLDDPEHPIDEAGLFQLCQELSNRFVRACLINDDPFAVREAMQTEWMKEFELPRERAEALFDLTLEVMHLCLRGRYSGSLAEVGHLIASVSGGLTEPGAN